jgi:hypothetical protein
MVDRPSNEQHEWGGRTFRPVSTISTGGQTFLASRPAADTDPSQVPFTASHSDDLFAPATGGPSHIHPYILPHVPDFYHHRRNELHTPTVPHSFSNNVQPHVHFPVPPLYHDTPLHPVSPRIHPYNMADVNHPPLAAHHAPHPQHLQPYPPFSSHSYQPHIPLSYPNPHIQYVYVPAPPTDTSLLTPPSKSLPVITSIHILNSKSDFYAWDEGVCTLLRLLGIHGHIVDPSLPVNLLNPSLSPALPPCLSQPPTPAELKALTRWQDNDNVAQYVIVGRLGGLARQLLPSAYMGTRTAYTMYTTLTRYFGLRNFGDCDELANSLLRFRCDSNRVQDYVAHWRSGVARLCSAKYPFSTRVFINAFVKSLPNTITFATLRAFLPDRLASWNDSDVGSFITITNEVMDLEVAFRNSNPPAHPRSGPRPSPLATQMLAPPPLPHLQPPPVPTASTSSVPATQSRVPRQSLSCNNCKDRGLRFTGHTDGTCFQPGGGMEGRREEYMSNKGRFHAMFVECLDNASSFHDPTTHSDLLSPPSSPFFPPTLDDELVLPPLVNLCVASSAQNVDFRDDLYIPCSLKFPPPQALASIDFKSAAMVSMVSLYNALLDSGCTHIIRDRHLFCSYLAKPISVGTANCGSLDALGTGDVEFRYPFGDRHVIFTLRGCLYAPGAPINLLSVGALVERGMSCLFSPGGITKVFYPRTHAKLPGFTFLATVSNRLSFLKLDFISPEPLASAFPARALIPSVQERAPTSFPRLRLDSLLWHCHFGHIGMEATRFALTKDYVRGVQFEGAFIRDHCIPCLVGKSPQHTYSHNGHRASKVGELLHMDICGPYPVQGPRGEKYFFSVLDDKSNWGFTFGLKLKSDAYSHYLTTEAFLERSNGVVVLAIRCGGELELTAGRMGDYLASKGIIVQRTVAYAHQQNGKSERYVRTIEEGGQALLADAGLPMSFWLDAVLTRQYLVNRLPTSTLPENTTPFEVITSGRKPDLSHLRVWGCECYVAVPNEIRGKAGPKRFHAIFVGYEEHRIGWHVRALDGKYSFSNDVIFDESLSGRLGVPRSPSSSTVEASSDSPRRFNDRPRARTLAGKALDEVFRLKALRKLEREKQRVAPVDGGAHGGVVVDVNEASALNGGAVQIARRSPLDVEAESLYSHWGLSDLSPTAEAIGYVASLVECSSFDNAHLDVTSLDSIASLSFVSSDLPVAFRVLSSSTSSKSLPFDLSKVPVSYAEALARSDAPVWRAAMDREKQSLKDMGAFEEVDLPPGEKTVGLKWVFDRKTDADGQNISGKEKARLVAQGFSQRPGQYGETYAPVAKLASVRILLAWAAVRDLEIYQFDCKTAFLHAKIRHPLFARPFPGYPASDPSKVLRILVALYGLRQSAYEFYMLISSILLALGMVRCEVDHGVFMGEWTSAPDSSVVMPVDGSPAVIYVPLHVDDGLAVTNSPTLYAWFLSSLSKCLHIVDLGPCSKFLNILILRDRSTRKIWLSSRVYVSELLDEWNLTSCRTVSTPFPSNYSDLPSAPPASLPSVSDADLVPQYQRLVGCLLYLAISTRPDISFYAMWLGQFNATPTRTHLLLAKHVLRYLAGTRALALCLGAPSSRIPSTLSGYIRNVGCADADWASDTVD